MNLITPDLGTVFWMFITFLIVLIILKKYAWKPILNALKARENSIESALQAAENAKKEIIDLQEQNELFKEKIRMERDKILKEARDIKDTIINEAKEQADEEAKKIILAARNTIRNERSVAVNEIKEQISKLSVKIAEKLLQEKLANDKVQQNLIDKLLHNVKLN